MNLFLFLFCMSANKLNDDNLSKENLDLGSSKMDMLKGIDTRNIDYKEPSLAHLIDLHQKHNRLLKLLNNNISLFEREILAKEYLDEYNSMTPNILAGDVLSDWEFEM